jgi:hypothetical protein
MARRATKPINMSMSMKKPASMMMPLTTMGSMMGVSTARSARKSAPKQARRK